LPFRSLPTPSSPLTSPSLPSLLLSACDDSKQNWYHSLACLRTNLEILKQHWPDLEGTSLQSDGAGNYSCTAFMTSLPRVGEVAKVRITDHAITEVGDGKNLVDTDFQQVTMSLNQRKDGGADVETAQQILDNLDANPTAGTTNAGLDLSARTEGKPPKPYTGIDGIYWRVFQYDGVGRCTGVRLHQFYGLGTGRLVSVGALRALWKEGGQLDAGAIPMVRLQPGAGEQQTASKRKLTEDHALEAKVAKVTRQKVRKAKKVVALLDEIAAERRREAERTTVGCEHEAAGCRRRFLSKVGAAQHGPTCTWRPKAPHSVTVARVHLHVRRSAMPPLSRRHRLSAAIDPLVGATLKVRRPLKGPAYGQVRYSILPQGTGVASNAEVRAAAGDAVSDGRVCAGLAVVASGEVRVTLRVNRPPLPPLAKGWAIKAPVVRTRYTDEQKALLLECFNNPTRPNERNAHELFKLRFNQRDGPFARSLVMSAAKIKAWYSSEKQRRQKAATVRFMAAEAQDEEDAEAEATRTDGGTANGRGRGMGSGRGCGRSGRGRGAAAEGTADSEGAAGAPPVPAASVAEMRAEMRRLGHTDEARAAKGTAAVRAALEAARANPREPAAASDADASDSAEGEEGDDEGDDEALEGEDVYAVQDIVAKRRIGRPQVTMYLVHWKGYSTGQNTWEPPSHIPLQLVDEFNESRVGLEEETENDDSSDGEESDADEAPARVPIQPARAAHTAKGTGKRAAPPPRAPPAKHAAAAAGSSSAAGARQAGKRAARPPPDSSDEEAQPAAKKVAAPKPKGKGKRKAKAT
jgi:hypothetical protein